ncbi:hypothetical protein CHS0354_006957, partial [Potamilus streckersoni]
MLLEHGRSNMFGRFTNPHQGKYSCVLFDVRTNNEVLHASRLLILLDQVPPDT